MGKSLLGFPEMVRFAFNLSRDAVEKMNALRANGATEKLNEFSGL